VLAEAEWLAPRSPFRRLAPSGAATLAHSLISAGYVWEIAHNPDWKHWPKTAQYTSSSLRPRGRVAVANRSRSPC
jgi:hypothetical protein